MCEHVCEQGCFDHACRFEKFGGLFRTNLLFNPMVVVTDENEVRRLLQVCDFFALQIQWDHLVIGLHNRQMLHTWMQY